MEKKPDRDTSQATISMPTTTRRHWAKLALVTAALEVSATTSCSEPDGSKRSPESAPKTETLTPGATHVLWVQVDTGSGNPCLRFDPEGGLRICKTKVNGQPGTYVGIIKMRPMNAIPLTVKQVPDSLATTHPLSDVFEDYPPDFDTGPRTTVLDQGKPLIFLVKDDVGIKERCGAPDNFDNEDHDFARGIHFSYSDSAGNELLHCDLGDHTDIHVEC